MCLKNRWTGLGEGWGRLGWAWNLETPVGGLGKFGEGRHHWQGFEMISGSTRKRVGK